MTRTTIRLVTVALVTAIMAMPAAAQMATKRGSAPEGPKGDEKPKVDDKAYKAAMERIPEPKEKYDPWGGVSQTPAPAPAKKK